MLLGVLFVLLAGTAVRAQAIDAGSMFRVFLTDGQAVPSFGESAVVGDRVIFTMIVGDGSIRTTMQLVSLPVAAVDLFRTARYAESMRAARYAATHGEAHERDARQSGAAWLGDHCGDCEVVHGKRRALASRLLERKNEVAAVWHRRGNGVIEGREGLI